ncbi:MAG: flagellar motor protein MotB [Pseudomonadota bacterium]
MADKDGVAPIIIKRKKVSGGDGHHGGAWKVAYADFVTAMMAFFLLMWLLNATTESQRKGIADYFAPSIPISPVSGGGSGVLSGETVFADDTLAQEGSGGIKQVASVVAQDPGAPGAGEEGDGAELVPDAASTEDAPTEQAWEFASGNADFEDLESRLYGMSGESDVADDLLSHIRTKITDEGLIIEIFAKQGHPLFESGSDEPSPKMQALLEMIGGVVDLVSNPIALTGHTDAVAYTGIDFDNWRLSSARADVTRRTLIETGIVPDRFNRITGKADRELALPDAPDDPRNRRITLTLLRSDR